MKPNRQAQIDPKITTVLMACLALSAAAKDIPTQPPKPDPKSLVTKESVKQLQEDFLKLKFGMFIHYNMATYKGVQWVLGYPDPFTFDPGGKIDTDAWAFCNEDSRIG